MRRNLVRKNPWTFTCNDCDSLGKPQRDSMFATKYHVGGRNDQFQWDRGLLFIFNVITPTISMM